MSDSNELLAGYGHLLGAPEAAARVDAPFRATPARDFGQPSGPLDWLCGPGPQFKKVIDRGAVLKVFKERLHGHTSPAKYPRAAHFVDSAFDR